MSQTPLSNIVARANQARRQVSTLGRSAFSDLGGGVSRGIGLGGGVGIGLGGGVGSPLASGFGLRTTGQDVSGQGLSGVAELAVEPTLTTSDASKFGLVCFAAGAESVCGGSIGNGSTFCLKHDCTISAHKRAGNIVPYEGHFFVRKNQDSAFIDPSMALERLDTDFLNEWKEEKLTLSEWITRVGAAKRGGIFSSSAELKYEMDLANKARTFKTPGRGPFKNYEETIDLEWMPYSPKMNKSTLEEPDLSFMAKTITGLELAVSQNGGSLKKIATKLSQSLLEAEDSLEMLDVKISGVGDQIGARPSGEIGLSAPTLWGALSHLADGLSLQSSINLNWVESAKNFVSKADLGSHFASVQAVTASNASLKRTVDEGQSDSTQVFTLLMDRLDKAEDLIVALQTELAQVRIGSPPAPSIPAPAFTLGHQNATSALEQRIAKLEVLSDSTCIQFSQLGLSSLSEVEGWVRVHYGNHRFGLMCDVYLLMDRILGDSDSDQLAMMNKMQYQVKCNLSTGAEAMALFSLSHIIPRMFHHTTSGSFGAGRHMSALSQLKSWEDWADGTHGMKQYILKRLHVVEQAMLSEINCVLLGGSAHPVNRAALACSVGFVNSLVQYIDTTMDMLHIQSGFSKKAAWALITQLVYRIFMDMSVVREGTLGSLRPDDPVASCGSVLWCVFRTQDKMAEFMSQGIANHSSISSEYVKFLAGHSSVGDIDKLQKEVTEATKAAKAAKESAVTAITKSDKASSQADKATKLATDHGKSIVDIQRDVKKLKDKL